MKKDHYQSKHLLRQLIKKNKGAKRQYSSTLEMIRAVCARQRGNKRLAAPPNLDLRLPSFIHDSIMPEIPSPSNTPTLHPGGGGGGRRTIETKCAWERSWSQDGSPSFPFPYFPQGTQSSRAIGDSHTDTISEPCHPCQL